VWGTIENLKLRNMKIKVVGQIETYRETVGEIDTECGKQKDGGKADLFKMDR